MDSFTCEQCKHFFSVLPYKKLAQAAGYCSFVYLTVYLFSVGVEQSAFAEQEML